MRDNETSHQHDDYSWEIRDARGIYITRACHTCYTKVMSEIQLTYSIDSLHNPQYVADEPVEDPNVEWDS